MRGGLDEESRAGKLQGRLIVLYHLHGMAQMLIIPLPPVAEEAEAIRLGSVVVISNRAKIKAPTPMSPSVA